MPRCPREKNSSHRQFDGTDTFLFNNVSWRFAGEWNPPEMRKLWRYNLHYMAWLFDLAEGREDWILRWIRENPPGTGDGWDPYPLSLRLFNWCKFYALAGRSPNEEVRRSISLQAGWLAASLEFHLDGNHLLENLLALQFAAFHLDTDRRIGAELRDRISRLLAAELETQFLEDGGHYEASPMYHAILVERLLDLLNVWPQDRSLQAMRDLVEKKARAGLDWLETMSVGGHFALFNDACYDAAPGSSLLLEFGAKLLRRVSLGLTPLRALSATGYYRAEAGPFTAIFDAGRLGPDHQMGHAQGDMLSFCLWLTDRPVLVHPGNYEYLPGEMRNYCRSTASHNTLSIEGLEQAEWWASHRVGRRGRIMEVSAAVGPSGTGALIVAAHDGFRRVGGGPIHRRELEVSKDRISIRDSLSALPLGAARVLFHVHPECLVEAEAGSVMVRTPSGSLRVTSEHPVKIDQGWHCPEFGLRIRNQVLVFEGCRTDFRCDFDLIP